MQVYLWISTDVNNFMLPLVTEEHSEMAGYFYDAIETISSPEAIYAGKSGECIATKSLRESKTLVVVYKEVKMDLL